MRTIQQPLAGRRFAVLTLLLGGFTAFGYLSQTVAPSVATTFSYVNPVVAMALGWLLFSGTHHLAHGNGSRRDRHGCLPDRIDEV